MTPAMLTKGPAGNGRPSQEVASSGVTRPPRHQRDYRNQCGSHREHRPPPDARPLPSAVVTADIAEPAASPAPAGRGGFVIEVHAAGVAFPDVLLSRGLYQMKPELPFVPGMEVAGIVRAAPADAEVRTGDRVAAFTERGGFAEVAVAPGYLTFKLPDALDFAQGAGLVLNYHTAVFALLIRGRLRSGDHVLVHGAAGGVGTATLQVARGLGARTIAVVSSDEKTQVARRAGADDVVRSVAHGAKRCVTSRAEGLTW